MMKDIPRSQRCGRMRGDLSSWHFRPPRRSHLIDQTRVISIRRDETGWHVVNGNGTMIRDGFDSNAAALAWVTKTRGRRVASHRGD